MTRNTIIEWRYRAARTAVLLLAAGSLTAGLAQPATATPVTPVRQPLTGLELVSYTNDDDGVSWVKLASKTCPNNKTVVGAGWSTNPSTTELRLQFLKLYEHSVTAQVYEDYSGYDPDWSLTVYAMCADRPSGWSLQSDTDTEDSDDYHSEDVDCPGDTKPLAAGVEHLVPHGQAVITDIDLTLTGARVSAYEHEDGYDDDWWIKVYAICADPPIGWELQSSDNQTSYPTTTEITGCTAGRTAISAGADLNGAHGEVVLKNLKTFAYGGGEYGMATASEDATGTPDDWELITDVICVEE
jgi:hypothetical protein